MPQTKVRLGYQLTASFEICNLELISDSGRILELLRQVTKLMAYEEVSHLTHTFPPHGITCVLILAQSHIIAHSWPEFRALVVDFFACGEPKFSAAIDLIKNELQAKSCTVETWVREVRAGKDKCET